MLTTTRMRTREACALRLRCVILSWLAPLLAGTLHGGATQPARPAPDPCAARALSLSLSLSIYLSLSLSLVRSLVRSLVLSLVLSLSSSRPLRFSRRHTRRAGFLGGYARMVRHMRVLRDASMPHRLMVLLQFGSPSLAERFRADYHAKRFNSLEPEVALVVHVAQVLAS